MLNVYELENRWKIYKIKSFIPYVVILTSSIIILTLSYFFIFSAKKEIPLQINNPVKVEKKQEEVQPTVATNNSIQESPPVIIQETQTILKQEVVTSAIQPLPQVHVRDKVILAPSLSFMKTMDRDSLPLYDNTPSVEEEVNQENSSNNTLATQKQPQTVVAQQVVVEQPSPSQPSSVSIQRKDTLSDLKQVVKRFEKNENPALSLFIAKKYYELGDYHKAYSYSLRTNDLNSNIEESWIIFSKSLVKLNEKEMAIKTLKQYIQHSNSNQAKVLLDEINSGKFK
jgi:tetratricopeptide (TPR) repeat protein